MKLVSLAWFLPVIAIAQQANTLQISAPAIRVMAGDSMQLTGIPLTASGSVVQQTVTWKVDQPTIATVSASGMLTGVSLGIVMVTATSGNLTRQTTFQITPDHVAILPQSADLLIGDKQQFTATAYDVSGNALPNIKWTWAITQTQDDSTAGVGYGTVDANGVLTAKYEGPSFVRALYTYTSPTGTVTAGMDARIPIYAPFQSTAPRAYTLKRLFNASQQLRVNPQLKARPTLLYPAANGRLLFNASLDGLGTALLAWDGSSFQTILAAGLPSNSAGSLVTDMGRHAIAENGNMLAQVSSTDSGVVWSGPPDALQPLLVGNVSAPGAENMSSFSLSRNSITSSGYFAFTASYRVPGTSLYVNGLFRGFRNNINEILFSQNEVAPELGVSGVSVSDFGIDDSGVAWYVANVPGRQTLYRHDFAGRKKFLQVGETFQGQAIKGFLGGRNSTPGYLVAENGDFLFGVNLADGSNYLLKYTGTAPDPQLPAEKLRVDNTTVTLAYRPGRGALIWGNPHTNLGDGAWLWNGDSLQSVAILNKAQIAGANITNIESGAMDADGKITLMVATATNLMLMVRGAVGTNPQLLFQAGDAVALAVPTVFNTFVGGSRTGNPIFITGSTTGASLAEFRDGAPQPFLTLGDKVLTGSLFRGYTPYGYTVRTANGDLYGLIDSLGIARYSNGKWSVAKTFPVKNPDGATSSQPYRISVNNAGSIAWQGGTDKSDTRIYLAHDGKVDLICNNGQSADKTGAIIDGLPLYSCDDFWLDDANRMFLRLHFQGETPQRTYVWENGTFKLAARLGVTLVNGRALTGVNQLRSGGTHLYGVLSSDAGTHVLEWVDGAWTTLMTPSSYMPTGFYLNGVSNLEGNLNGDLIFQSQSYPSNGMYLRRNGKLATIFTTSRRTPDGDFLVNIQGLDIRDDGTIYLLALNEFDEMVLYQGTPN